MGNRRYFSARAGKLPNGDRLDLPMLLRLFRSRFSLFCSNGYFQEAFGYECVDAGNVSGTLGTDIEAQVLLAVRKQGLWPIIEESVNEYSEDDIFDVIEFLHDHISKPIDGYEHTWNQCGWHYNSFDLEAGRREWREAVNELLVDYKEGFELSLSGEILALPEKGFDNLLVANLPPLDDENISKRVEKAISKFRRHRSSLDDRKDAIRELADVLEFLRTKLKGVITKSDESDLFNIANNFGIRHHNDQQKTDYDRVIWYSWIFYFYLATIHASIRLIEKNQRATN